MNTLVIDTSVTVKWFHEGGEQDVEPARALLDAHVTGRIDAKVLDLGLYELGNVLGRVLRWPAKEVAEQLDDLVAICGPVIRVEAPIWALASEVSAEHGLTFYDAAWVATAQQLGARLVTADQAILRAGLGISLSEVAKDLEDASDDSRS